MRARVFVLGLLALAFALSLPAHDTWIQARQTVLARGQVGRFDLTSGGEFPALDFAVRPDRIAREGIRVDGKAMRFSGRNREKSSLVLSRKIDRAGIAAVWVDLKPKTLELKPELIGEYLEEIGEEALGRQLAASPPSRWREVYRKHAKTFLRVGARKESDRSWSEPVGAALEIVPERDPTSLRAGETLAVRVLHEGQPLPNFPLASIAAGRKERKLARTDSQGRAGVLLDQSGSWLLAGTRLVRSTRPATDWESDFVTLTFSVLDAPASASAPGSSPPPAAVVPDQPFTGPAPKASKPYEEIVRRKEAGESNEALLARIRKENVPYSLTTFEVQKLRAAGVSEPVIEAMLKSGRRAATPKPR